MEPAETTRHFGSLVVLFGDPLNTSLERMSDASLVSPLQYSTFLL